MSISNPESIDHAGGILGIASRRHVQTRRAGIARALNLLIKAGASVLAAAIGVNGRCLEFGASGYPGYGRPRLPVVPVSQYPGQPVGPEASWIRITSMRIEFTSFTLPLKEQEILVRPQSVVPSVSIDALVARVDTTLKFVQAGLSGRPMVATQPLVFVFADPESDQPDAPILAASFFRGYLHGPLWLLHPKNGNPLFFGEYEKGFRSGRFLVYDPEGLEGLRFYGEYKNNRKHGVFIVLEEGRPTYAAFYQADIPQGEWLVEWSGDEPQLIAVADIPSDKMEVLRRCQRTTNWAEHLIRDAEPPIKQVVVQIYRKIDQAIKRLLAASYSVAARQRILNRYEQLSAAQKSFHATVLENATAGTAGSVIYGGIAAQARSEMARASMRNMNEALRTLLDNTEVLTLEFRETVLVVIQKTLVLLQEDV
ncbi:toxin-antitoxin system YwqK family antitoxin [Thermopirellula anaerolimosa]